MAARVYLAARYSRREELLAYAAALRARGYDVGARWLAGDHQWDPMGEIAAASEQVWEQTGSYPPSAVGFAVDDLEDVEAADIVISFTERQREAVGAEDVRIAVEGSCDRSMHAFEILPVDYEPLAAALNRRAAKASRGGRHVEFGLAVGRGKRCIVVGPRENVFHLLPTVEHYADWAAALESLEREAIAL